MLALARKFPVGPYVLSAYLTNMMHHDMLEILFSAVYLGNAWSATKRFYNMTETPLSGI